MRTGSVLVIASCTFVMACGGGSKDKFEPEFEEDFIDVTPAAGVEPTTQAQSNVAIVGRDAIMFPMDMMPEVADWQPGRVIVSGPGQDPTMGNPLGFARKVVSVEQSDGMAVVHTEKATVYDLFAGELQVRLDQGATEVDPNMLDEQTFDEMVSYLYPQSQPPGFFQVEPLKSNAPVTEEEDGSMPGSGGSFLCDGAGAVAQAGSDTVGCCQFIPDTVNKAGDIVDGKIQNIENIGANMLVGITEGDFDAFVAAATEFRSFLTPPPISLYSHEISGSFNTDGDVISIGLPKRKYNPFPNGFEVTKPIKKNGNTVELFLAGNGSISAGFELRPAFQFYLSIPVAGTPNALHGWLELQTELDLDIDLELSIEAGVRSVTIDGTKYTKGQQAYKDNVDNNAMVASAVYNAERENMFGEEDLKPHSSFKKTLLRSRPYVQTFTAGPVPVVITWSMTLDLVCGFEAKAGLTATFSYADTFRLRGRANASNEGISFDTPELSRLNTRQSVSILGGGKAVVSCGLVPRVHSMLYDAIGLNVGLRGSLEASVSYQSVCKANTTTPGANLSASLDASVGVPVGGQFRIPGAGVEIASTPEAELWNRKFNLTSKSWTFDQGIGYCTPLCENGRHDSGIETDTDCGGECIRKCEIGKKCAKNTDCEGTANCMGGLCVQQPCFDGFANNKESDVDCGGEQCEQRCADAARCRAPTDCASGYCKLQNGFEYGECVASSCADGITSGSELGVDCGGADCNPCRAGTIVRQASACASGYALPADDLFVCVDSHCRDEQVNGGESGKDCGGATDCDRCGIGGDCAQDSDCAGGYQCGMSGVCEEVPPAMPTCDDRLRNASETDIDCGGPTCSACAFGHGCQANTDCATGKCYDMLQCAGSANLNATGVPGTDSAEVTLMHTGISEPLMITGDGQITFNTPMVAGENFSAAVTRQPEDHECTVTPTGGVVTTDLTALTLTCQRTRFVLGGSVSGLAGSVILRAQPADETVTVAGDGAYQFPSTVQTGAAYTVTVDTDPSGQTCSLGTGSGTMPSMDVTDANVTCVSNLYTIGGTVSGLSGSVTLQQNGAHDLVIASDGAFAFAQPVAFNNDYMVTVSAQPAGQVCSVSMGSGTVGAGNVSDVQVTCANSSYTIGGTISGLTGSVTLQQSGGDNLVRSSNGVFTFATPVAMGAVYDVTVAGQPNGQTCTVSAGSGTVPPANVTDVVVSCVDSAAGATHCWGAEGNGNDSAGGNHATVNGDVSFLEGQAGQAFHCSGTSGAGANVVAASAPSVSATGPWTYEAWINVTSAPAGGAWIIDRAVTSSGGALASLFIQDDLTAYWVVRDDSFMSVFPPTSPIFDVSGGWHHVAITRGSGQFAVYLDGTLTGSFADSLGAMTLDPPKICGHHSGTSGVVGDVDSVKVWSIALSSAQVDAIAGGDGSCAAAPPQHCWAGDNDGTDSIGTADATVHGDVTYVAGRSGQAFHCSGSAGANQNVVMGSAPTVGTTDPFTFEAWVNVTSVPSGGRWLIDRVVTGGNALVSLYVQDDLNGYWVLRDDAGAWGFATSPLMDLNGGWHHVAITRGGGQLTVYRDGVSAGSAADALGAMTLAPPRVCGHEGATTGAVADVDSVKIWSTALSQKRLETIANGDGSCTAP